MFIALLRKYCANSPGIPRPQENLCSDVYMECHNNSFGNLRIRNKFALKFESGIVCNDLSKQ